MASSLSRSPPASLSLNFMRIPSSSPTSPFNPKSPTLSPVYSDQINGKRGCCLRACSNYSSKTQSSSIGNDIDYLRGLLMKPRSYYELLGVASDASQHEIRAAYRQMARKYHPDVVPFHQLDEATKIFSEINQAYDTLSSPEKKKAYDIQQLQLQPRFSRSKSSPSSSSSSSSSSFKFWRGRNWETDQCWC